MSKRSRALSAQDEVNSQVRSPSPDPADPGTVAELRKQIEELASQNSELVLKVQVILLRKERKCTDTHRTAHIHTCLHLIRLV